MNMGLGKLRELVMDREAWRAAVMGLQIVRHDWVTELNWTEHVYIPGGSHGKESIRSARDLGSIPGSERSPGEGNGAPL